MFIRRASGFPQHDLYRFSGKYLRHSISRRLYNAISHVTLIFNGLVNSFARKINSLYKNDTAYNQCHLCSIPAHIRSIAFLLYPCFQALHLCHRTMLNFILLRLRLIYMSDACSILFRCVHPFAGKAAYCLSHRPSWLCHCLYSYRPDP